MNESFKPAPPGTVAILWTLGFIGVFLYFLVRVGLAVSGNVSPDLYDVGGALILLGFILYGWARSVKSYRVSDGEMSVERMAIAGVRIPLSLVKSAQSQPDIGGFFNNSMFGSGGLFGWGGKARVRKPSDVTGMEAYVYGANPKKSVVFYMEGGKNIVVTPADPQAFLAAIRKASVRPAATAETPAAPTATLKKKRKRA